MDDDFDSGLFNISISDSEGDDVDISHGFAQASKVDRKGQSEAQFQVVKRDYRPKVENGEVRKPAAKPVTLMVPKSQEANMHFSDK